MRKQKRELMDKLVNGTINIRTITEVDENREHDFIIPTTIRGTELKDEINLDELTPQEAYVAGFIEAA
jgi:hypothetical protein